MLSGQQECAPFNIYIEYSKDGAHFKHLKPTIINGNNCIITKDTLTVYVFWFDFIGF